MLKFAGGLASIALMITTLNVNSTCMFIIHQPKMTESASKLRKTNVL
ncbi:cyclic lactone autoinducer peptide [Abyssisolibacter fermentans]|nr:cyclic lactone autoinducer peptide [Abyssisolibacter fermentans]